MRVAAASLTRLATEIGEWKKATLCCITVRCIRLHHNTLHHCNMPHHCNTPHHCAASHWHRSVVLHHAASSRSCSSSLIVALLCPVLSSRLVPLIIVTLDGKKEELMGRSDPSTDRRARRRGASHCTPARSRAPIPSASRPPQPMLAQPRSEVGLLDLATGRGNLSWGPYCAALRGHAVGCRW